MAEENHYRYAAFMLLFGDIEFFIFLNIAGFLDKGYSISNNTISHLGIDSLPYIFNIAIIVLGLSEIAASMLLKKYSRAFLILLFTGGIGAMGVGMFNEHFGHIHLLFALLAFLSPSILSFFAMMKNKNILGYEWALMGSISIAALILYISGIYLGLGNGGMERMVMIPELIWVFQFAAVLYVKQ